MNVDESFIRRLKELQPAAFDELVEQFEGSLYRFFYCDHGDHHIAQEQSAETFSQLVSALQSFRGRPEQLGAFVFGIAKNIQRRRWRNRRKAHRPIDPAIELRDTEPAADQRAIDREQLELTMKAVEQLEQPMRNVIVLRFIEGFSIDEIAAALEMPAGTVKSHIHRGRTKLKQCLKSEGYLS